MLPAIPDQASVLAMAAGAGVGVAGATAITAYRWIVRPGFFGERNAGIAVQIPGAAQVDDPYPAPWSAAGLRVALYGALVGATGGWCYQTGTSIEAIRLLVEGGAAIGAAWILMRVLRDPPAIGEPPVDDPKLGRSARLRDALFKLAGAGFMALIAFHALRK